MNLPKSTAGEITLLLVLHIVLMTSAVMWFFDIDWISAAFFAWSFYFLLFLSFIFMPPEQEEQP